MTWEELRERLTRLSSFFISEVQLIPREVAEKMLIDRLLLISVPVIFETNAGKKLKATMNIDFLGEVNIVPEHPSNKAGIPSIITIVNTPASVTWPPIKSYRDFMQMAEAMFVYKLEEPLVENSLVRAYYNFRRAAENYLRRANKLASANQKDRWIANKEITIATNALREVVKVCDASRTTVGRSKTIGSIRHVAAEALGKIDYRLIQQNIVVPLPE